MSKKKHRHPPREVACREDRYMGMAWMYAYMSKDPSTQVGSIIVTTDNRPLGFGYNGPPKQIRDDEINWTRPDKYPFILHAEHNALKHCSENPRGATLYVTGKPCRACMLEIVERGIFKVIYHDFASDKSSMLASIEEWEITKEIARLGGVQLEAFKGNLHWIRDWTSHLHAKGVFDQQ